MHRITYTYTYPHTHAQTLMHHMHSHTHAHLYTHTHIYAQAHACTPTFTHLYTHFIRVHSVTHTKPTRTMIVMTPLTESLPCGSPSRCLIYAPVKGSLYPLDVKKNDPERPWPGCLSKVTQPIVAEAAFEPRCTMLSTTETLPLSRETITQSLLRSFPEVQKGMGEGTNQSAFRYPQSPRDTSPVDSHT